MERENRKATDVLLELENKIEVLLQIVRSQDLNIKLLSNKLNIIIEKVEKQPANPPKIMVEAVNSLPQPVVPQPPTPQPPGRQFSNDSLDNPNNIPISSDFNIPTESAPQGFRRTSRPETFAGDDIYLNRDAPKKFPLQIPQNKTENTNKPINNNAEVIVNNTTFQERLPPEDKKSTKAEKSRDPNSIPVIQRIVDKNGKSVFLADIEVLDLTNQNSVAKTRTNGTGKWMSSLPVGSYRVFVRKRESLSKEKIEVAQDIQVDGLQSPLELQTMIIR